MSFLTTTFTYNLTTTFSPPYPPPNPTSRNNPFICVLTDNDRANLSQSTLYSILHDHPALIRLNPLVISHTPISREESGLDVKLLLSRLSPANSTDKQPGLEDWKYYSITDRLPWPLLSRLTNAAFTEMTYTAALNSTPTGLSSLVSAPAGVYLYTTWTLDIHKDPSTKQIIGGVGLTEYTVVQCNVLLAWYVKSDLQASHKVLHERIQGEFDRRIEGEFDQLDRRWEEFSRENGAK